MHERISKGLMKIDVAELGAWSRKRNIQRQRMKEQPRELRRTEGSDQQQQTQQDVSFYDLKMFCSS